MRLSPITTALITSDCGLMRLSPITTALITSDCGLNATALEHVGPDHLGLLQITNSDATNWGMYTVDLTVYLVGVYELNVLTGGDSHFSRVLPF